MGAQRFVDKIQKDPKFRADFVKDPIAALASEGITLSAKDQQELLKVIREFMKPYVGDHGGEVKMVP